MDDLDSLPRWTRTDIGLQDADSLKVLMTHVARRPASTPAFVALIGSLSNRVILRDHPEIQAILQNRLPCAVIARKSAKLHSVPKSVVSVYNKAGADVFYIRVAGTAEREDAANTLTKPDTAPPDEIELDLSENDSEYSRSLILIFSLAHSIIWFQSDRIFANYDLRLLKIVDLARLKGLKAVQSKLANVTENKEWIREGSLCCPRLVFVFSGVPSGPNVQEVEKDAAVRVYTILKKCRLISIPRSSGLCFLSANRETVVFVPENNPSAFPQKDSVRETGDKDTAQFALGMREPHLEDPFGTMLKACVADIVNSNSVSAGLRPAGFPWPSHFCKPPLAEWFAAAIQLHSLLYSGEEFRYLLDAKLGTTMSISRKYSKSVAAFSINNFEVRSDEPGTQQISYGIYSYMQFARGPATKNYGIVLTSFISDHVYARRQCSAHSILGSPCVKQVHLTPHQQTKVARNSKKARLPVLYHQSRVSYISFCSCGKTAHQRPDPFNVREANELFYETMDFKCCSLLESRIDFSSRTANRKDKKGTEEKKVEPIAIKRRDSFPELSATVTHTDKEKSQPVAVEAPPEQPPKQALKVSSPLMFQVGMSFDTVPRISSWVIHGLGPANRYRHSYGLEHHIQADFLNLYHHLIPCDAEIQLTRPHKIAQNIPNRPSRVQTIEPRPWHSLIFFGLDYECPKGHRFIYKSKEIADLSAEGKEDDVQAIVEDLLRNGAPLFLRCPCKNTTASENKQFIAQLMRIHVITPKDPMQLAILPKVKVGRGTPTFSPGVEMPVILEANMYYVLRLPFCYYDSVRRKGPFCAPRNLYPKHRKLPYSGSLLGGFLKFMESAVDRT
ncbi:hypothetical protein RvY_09166 [Ramazzottius varieornatus]|uniref:Nonsense-mediated mRNA decay factor SMG8 n=1 Tax=Ramazzottius varieornatus TaxID=947166 RepID=A0A1D1V8C7_RAMVA|nr:hypothetical protein RvY_09166 [Ramazzottius varieornatus]